MQNEVLQIKPLYNCHVSIPSYVLVHVNSHYVQENAGSDTFVQLNIKSAKPPTV
jgi:hypothetical protein